MLGSSRNINNSKGLVTTAKQAQSLQELPPIRRARGYRIYDTSGRRYLDLSLSGGRALLGHRPQGTLLELKNLLSRGLAGDFHSVFEHRLAKALLGLLPDHPVMRVYANEERLLSMLSRLVGGTATIFDAALDADANFDAGDVRLRRWRPFLAWKAPEKGPSIALPLLPFPGVFAPAIACIRDIPEAELPPSDTVSPALLGALVRCVYDLRALEGYDEPVWSQFDAPWWERRGPYLIARCENREYSALFRRLLEKGIFISPHYPGPSVVPAEFTSGEIEPLRRIAGEWRQNER